MAERARRGGAARLIARWRPVAMGLAAVVLLNVVLHLIVVRRMVALSGDREAILDARRDELALAAAQVGELEATVSKVACTRADLRHVFDELLSSKAERLTAIVRELRRLAEDNRMDPASIAFQARPVPGSDLVRFSISFPLEAPYATLRQFVGQVEASENFLLVENVTLSGERAQGRDLRLQVRVVTFFRDPDLERLEALFRRRSR